MNHSENYTPDPELIARLTAEAAALEQARTPERREAAKFTVAIAAESIASDLHTARNEDAVLGDPRRLAPGQSAELKTARPDEDRRIVELMRQREAAVAPALHQRFAALIDGISGEGQGSGLVASAMAAGIMSERLSAIPADANAEETMVGMIKAFEEANDVIYNYAQNRPDLLKKIGATAAAVGIVNGPDGRPQVPFVYGGNTRVYHYRRATNELIEISLDDTFVGNAVRVGQNPAAPALKRQMSYTKASLTPAEYRLINDSKDGRGLDSTLVEHRHKRDTLAGPNRALGFVAKGELHPHAGVIEAEPGDRVVLLTDGAHGTLSHDELTALIGSGADPAEICFEAKGRLGYADDCSAVVIDLPPAA